MAERIGMPIIGGPRSGRVVHINPALTRTVSFAVPAPLDFLDFDGPVTKMPDVVSVPVRRFAYTLPGRVDRQMFFVLLWPDFADDIELAIEVVLDVWRGGWCPDDSTSEWPTRLDVWHQLGVNEDAYAEAIDSMSDARAIALYRTLTGRA